MLWKDKWLQARQDVGRLENNHKDKSIQQRKDDTLGYYTTNTWVLLGGVGLGAKIPL